MKLLVLCIAAIGFVLIAIFSPLPIAPEVDAANARLYLGAALLSLVLSFSLGFAVASSSKLEQKASSTTWLLTVLALCLGYYSLKTPMPLWTSCLILCVSAFVFSVFIRQESNVSFSVAAGFLLFCAFALASEGALRSVPGEVFSKQVRKTPPLVQPDQVNIVYKKNWFRGKRPCVNCPDKNIRIITLGGSSTYGVPMYYGSLAYTQSLQRILDERRPGENFEVLNAGVAAYGITQVIAALNEELLKYKPTIVSVCSWFNDSAPNNRWYQMPGISDREAYQRHRSLQRLGEFPLYKKIRASKLFALSRWSLLGLKSAVLSGSEKTKRSSIPRMTPEEFRSGLEEIVNLGKQHNFLPVFVLEALHRSDSLPKAKSSNDYFKQMFEVAREHDLPVVDTISRLHEVHDQWTFHDFIHPNAVGHRIIAESMYQDLVANPVTKHTKEFLESKGVDFSKPEVQLEHRLHISSKQLKTNGLVLKIRAPFLEEGVGKLEVVVDNDKVHSLPGLSNTFKEFRLPAEVFSAKRPLTDVRVQALIDHSNNPDWAIGTTGISSPDVIHAISGGKNYGWRVSVRVDNQRIDSDGRGYNVTLIDSIEGDVLKQKHFDTFGSPKNSEALVDYISQLVSEHKEKKRIVVVAVKTDGRHNVNGRLLGEAFKSLGGSGSLPNGFESFLLIGSPGAKPGTAIEEIGKRLIEKVVGSKEQSYARLLELQSGE